MAADPSNPTDGLTGPARSLREAKAAFRVAVLERRAAAADAPTNEAASHSLAQAILASPHWHAAQGVAAFFGVRGEPTTQVLLAAALAQGKRLWLPRVLHGTRGESELAEITTLAQLEPARFGLMEPRRRSDESTLPAFPLDGPIHLILVPGLAFDRTGARIGFGPGHYDRLLAPVAHASSPLRVGVCFSAFFNPIEGPIPTEPHDVPMHAIATEAGVHMCTTK